jgi:hypothetical protein
VPHAAGGPTRLRNLVLLCGTHHRLLHRQRWRLTGNPDERRDDRARLRFWRADGREIPTCSVRGEPGPTADPSEPASGTMADRGPHNADRLDAFALDVLVSHLLDPPPDG